MHREEWPGCIDALSLHRLAPERYPFLLQSAAAHPQAGRYDIVFAFPEATIEVGNRGNHAGFFDALDRLPIDRSATTADEALPFTGGWFLFLGYEAVRGIEPRLQLPDAPDALPDMLAVRCPAAVIVDRLHQRTVLIAESDASQLEQMQRDVKTARDLPVLPVRSLIDTIDEEPASRFTDGVRRVLDYLQAGDVFQVNLSRRWQARLQPGVDAAALYEQLRRTNPAPFAGLAHWRGSIVLSSSPERLIEINGRIAQTRPIAGTRARRDGDDADLRQREKLIGSLKERAEHVMLIDLERNDLGRVCVPGSVEVSELMTIESYAHVHHIVSNVRGRLRDEVGPGSALRAVFPGGTITGAPKVRAMEIIAELEGTDGNFGAGAGRGAYTGAMGYLSRDGRLDTNILIRSLVVGNGRVSFRAGAGIVADSEPDSELAETRAKARGLLLALGARPGAPP